MSALRERQSPERFPRPARRAGLGSDGADAAGQVAGAKDQWLGARQGRWCATFLVALRRLQLYLSLLMFHAPPDAQQLVKN